ncbi:hypothetical protein GCM10009682_12270 [Luedemannella flava]|uniref:N-acetyltransferase domain-containing protein n=1 Tax=Luedemannella flava TaxID=349316 RepID=A0ABP4XVK3_9ACTN
MREVDSLPELNQLAQFFMDVWSAPNIDHVINCATLRALAHGGNYVAAAYRGGDLVGGAVAFLGMDADGIQLLSHLAGVLPGGQSKGVGRVLKQHQRAWALRRGIGRICWTFDPLVSRNAYFNLQKLGALPVAYLPNFYGALDDGINAGDATDRLWLRWETASKRATDAALDDLADPDAAALRAAGAVVLLDRSDDRPVTSDDPTLAAAAAARTPLLVAVPADIERMRPDRPATASAWREALRWALDGALAAGYRFEGFDRAGWYVLVRDEGSA